MRGEGNKIIGTLTYSMLDYQVPVLYVHQDQRAGPGLAFERVLFIPKEIDAQLPNLPQIIDRAVRRVYENYHRLFGKQKLKDLLRQMACQSTFFQDADLFAEMHRPRAKICGNYYHKTSKVAGKEVQQGSYIRVDEWSDIELLVMHEWGHELHHRLCERGIAPFDYEQYDEETREVQGIVAERLAGVEEYDEEPHLTANELVARILQQQIALQQAGKKIGHHEVVQFLLQYRDHRTLASNISIVEEQLQQSYPQPVSSARRKPKTSLPKRITR